eukprot:345269_1
MSSTQVVALWIAAQSICVINSDCNGTLLDVITQSALPRPAESVLNTTVYGDSKYSPSGLYLNQGRINTMNNWGIFRNDKLYNNTLYITEWNSDHKNISDDGELGYAGGSLYSKKVVCASFTLDCDEYIVGYRIYDSIDCIHGLSWYTSSGCRYDCIGNPNYTSAPVTDHGISSYYYGNTDFWYLTGFYGRNGMIVDALGFQFTKLTTRPTCQPTQTPTHPPSTPAPSKNPTFSPSNYPTLLPSYSPTFEPSINPTKSPSAHVIFHMSCNDHQSGIYNRKDLLTFHVSMPHAGSVVFDARASNLTLLYIYALDASNHSLNNASNHDGIVRVLGDANDIFTFNMMDGDVQTSSTYDVNIYCESLNLELTQSTLSLFTTYPAVHHTVNTLPVRRVHASGTNKAMTAVIVLVSVILCLLCLCACVYLCWRRIKHQKELKVVSDVKQYSYEQDVNALQIRSATPSANVSSLHALSAPFSIMQGKTTSVLISDYLKSQNTGKISLHDESSSESHHATDLHHGIHTPAGGPDELDLMTVRTWFQLDVKLPMYYETFVENGYEKLEFIKDITTESELIDLGISSQEHRVIILRAIRMLDEEHLMLEEVNEVNMANHDGSIGVERDASVYSEGPDEADKQQFIQEIPVKSEGNDILYERNDKVLSQGDDQENEESDDNALLAIEETYQGDIDISDICVAYNTTPL